VLSIIFFILDRSFCWGMIDGRWCVSVCVCLSVYESSGSQQPDLNNFSAGFSLLGVSSSIRNTLADGVGSKTCSQTRSTF
jgi:hypothetical protein